MQCILDYLCSVPEVCQSLVESLIIYCIVDQEEDIGDVLELLMALLFEQQQEIMVKLFCQCNGVKSVNQLIPIYIYIYI